MKPSCGCWAGIACDSCRRVGIKLLMETFPHLSETYLTSIYDEVQAERKAKNDKRKKAKHERS